MNTQTNEDIAVLVRRAKDDPDAADALLRQYLPFIKAETSKHLHRGSTGEFEDGLSIAMFAFHEATLAYDEGRGAFLPFAARAIRNRLIDHQRREGRHSGVLSLDQPAGEEEDGLTLLHQVDTGEDQIAQRQEQSDARREIAHFAQDLAAFGLQLTDIADNCPKQSRTLAACHRALAYARSQPQLLAELIRTKKVPLGPLAQGSGVERKTLERHRKYLVAILLAYTNGFEIIRGHLRQLAPEKGGALQ